MRRRLLVLSRIFLGRALRRTLWPVVPLRVGRGGARVARRRLRDGALGGRRARAIDQALDRARARTVGLRWGGGRRARRGGRLLRIGGPTASRVRSIGRPRSLRIDGA